LGAEGAALLRTPWIIAATSIVFGVLLGWVDWRARMDGQATDLGFRQYFLLGLFQAVALIPGTSRSGITIMAGRGLGLFRPAAGTGVRAVFPAAPVPARGVDPRHLALGHHHHGWARAGPVPAGRRAGLILHGHSGDAGGGGLRSAAPAELAGHPGLERHGIC